MFKKGIFLSVLTVMVITFNCTNLEEPTNPVAWFLNPMHDAVWIYTEDNTMEISLKINKGAAEILEDSVIVWVAKSDNASFEDAALMGKMTKVTGSDDIYKFTLDFSKSYTNNKGNKISFSLNGTYTLFATVKDANSMGAISKRTFIYKSSDSHYIYLTVLGKNKVQIEWDNMWGYDETSKGFIGYTVYRSLEPEVNPFSSSSGSVGTVKNKTGTRWSITDTNAPAGSKVYYRLFLNLYGQLIPLTSSSYVLTPKGDWTQISTLPYQKFGYVKLSSDGVGNPIGCFAVNSTPCMYYQCYNGIATLYTVTGFNLGASQIFSILPTNDTAGYIGSGNRIARYTGHTTADMVWVDYTWNWGLITGIEKDGFGKLYALSCYSYEAYPKKYRVLKYENDSWANRNNYSYQGTFKLAVSPNGKVWLYGLRSDTNKGSIIDDDTGLLAFEGAIGDEIHSIAFNSNGYGIAASTTNSCAEYVNGSWKKITFPSYIYADEYFYGNYVFSDNRFILGTPNDNMYLFDGESYIMMNIQASSQEKGSIWGIILDDTFSNGIIYTVNSQDFIRAYSVK